MSDTARSRRITAPRSSAVSGAWRAIHADIETHGEITWEVAGTDDVSQSYRLVIATDRATRARAYRLAHRVYARQGHAPNTATGMCLSRFDSDPQTLTLLIERADGRDVATISLVFESSLGLPCDETYPSELQSLRAGHHKLVEVTRLVLDVDHTQSKHLLLRLFEIVYIFARRVRGFSDFVIEVSPRHAGYYRRLLGFEQIGPERPCPRVQGAPAVLLRLNLVEAENTVASVRYSEARPLASHLLWKRICSAEDEMRIAEFLARGHRPMSREEALSFNLMPAIAALAAG